MINNSVFFISIKYHCTVFLGIIFTIGKLTLLYIV